MTVVSTHPLNVHRFARLTRAIFAVGVWFLSPVSPAQSPGVTTDVPAAIAALGDPDSLVRLAAVDLLSREKGQAVNLALQTALHDKNRTVRATAAVALYKRGFDFDLDVIRKDLFDSDPVTQANAAKALCDMGRTVPDDLISSLLSSSEVRVRYRAVELVGACPDYPERIPTLARMLEDGDNLVRTTVLSVIKMQKDKRVIPILIKALHDPDRRVRVLANGYLGKSGYPLYSSWRTGAWQ